MVLHHVQKERTKNLMGLRHAMGGTECWTQSCDKYVMASIQSVEATLVEKGNKLSSKCVTPFNSGYRPELDTSAE